MKRYNLIVVFLCLSFISFGQGECKGDCENGNGIYTWDDGTQYNGEWLDRQQHGNGIYSSEKYTYDGEWFEGKWHGFGVYTSTNGHKYEGNWLNGKRNGSGIYSSEEHTYDGEWVDGKQHGQGIYFWKNGDKYDGEWDDGRRHGEGTQSYHDHRIWKGIFKQGEKLKGYYNTDNNSYDKRGIVSSINFSNKDSKNSLIPKLCNAVPKKTGVCEPDKYFFMSNCSYTPFIKAISSVIA